MGGKVRMGRENKKLYESAGKSDLGQSPDCGSTCNWIQEVKGKEEGVQDR